MSIKRDDVQKVVWPTNFINMTFDAGVLPIAQFRECEDQYINLLKEPANKEETGHAANALLGKFNNMWDFFRRGGFYSANEDMEEFSTNCIRFFLIPYYIGRLHMLFQGVSRPEHLEAASAILTAFSEEMTRLCVIGEDKPFPTAPAERRTRTIADFQDKKELEARIQAVNKNSTRDDLQRGFIGDAVDEETERDLISTVLKLCAMEARAIVRSATDELPLARMMAAGVKPEEPSGPPPKMWVHRIDREDQRKKVFAPLEDIMPRPLPPDDETWAQPDVPGPRLSASDDEEAEEARKKAADWDDWKDDHPPFSGM